MSRAININASIKDVRTACTNASATITAIESLHSGGTRVVLANADSAAAIAKKFGGKVMTGTVQRTPLTVGRRDMIVAERAERTDFSARTKAGATRARA